MLPQASFCSQPPQCKLTITLHFTSPAASTWSLLSSSCCCSGVPFLSLYCMKQLLGKLILLSEIACAILQIVQAIVMMLYNTFRKLLRPSAASRERCALFGEEQRWSWKKASAGARWWKSTAGLQSTWCWEWMMLCPALTTGWGSSPWWQWHWD